MRQLQKDSEYEPKVEQEKTQHKVDGSKVLNKHNTQILDLRSMGEQNASLKMRMKNLLKQQKDINQSLDQKEIDRSRVRGGSRQNWRESDYLIAAPITMKPQTPSLHDNSDIKVNQDRIKQLIKERQRTLEEIEDVSDFDPLDVVDGEEDNKFQDQVRNYYNQLGKIPGLTKNKNNQHLDNVRIKLSELQKNPKYKVLSNYIEDTKNKSAGRPYRDKIRNMNISLPPEDSPYTNLNQINGSKMPRPMLKSPLIDPAKSRNHSTSKLPYRTIEDVDKNSLQNRSSYLPDIGHFRQNDIRPDDMEVEERALMNLYAQDFDELKLLDLVSKDPDLYQHKLNQYKDMSEVRIQAEK